MYYTSHHIEYPKNNHFLRPYHTWSFNYVCFTYVNCNIVTWKIIEWKWIWFRWKLNYLAANKKRNGNKIHFYDDFLSLFIGHFNCISVSNFYSMKRRGGVREWGRVMVRESEWTNRFDWFLYIFSIYIKEKCCTSSFFSPISWLCVIKIEWHFDHLTAERCNLIV